MDWSVQESMIRSRIEIGKGFVWVVETQSLYNCVRGALVDACSTVDACTCIDDCDVVDGDCVRGASVHACSAADTVFCFDSRHDGNLCL